MVCAPHRSPAARVQQLKRGRNIVLEQLNRRRSQSKPTVEEDERSLRSDGAPPGVDRTAAEYAML
jgi:hypothetical protein